MIAYLSKILMVIDGYEQEKTILLAFLRSYTPPSRNGQGKVEDILIASCGDGHYREFNVGPLLKVQKDCF